MSVVTTSPTDTARSSRLDLMSVADTRSSMRQPLRVLTYLNSFAPGGVERIAVRLHAAWRVSGVDSTIVLADASFAPPIRLDHVAQIAATAQRHALARFGALATGLPKRITEDRPHILFCAGNTYSALAVVLKIALGPACPPIVAKISNCLVRPDMTPPVRFFYRLWLRIQGRYIDHFVGMAPAMRGEIASFIGAPQDRISIIADPALSDADLARLAMTRDSASRARAGRHYLAVGRLVPQKNFALLLDAFAKVGKPNDTLRILGEGPERCALEARIAQLGIADRVYLPGHLDPLDQWLAEADVFVLSSDYEGVPAVLIEALAAGLPIVATDCCVSMVDLLGHGALGRMVPTGDAAALGEAMAAPCADTPATVAARRAAAAAFTIEHSSEQYLALMRALAARHAADTATDAPQSDSLPAHRA